MKKIILALIFATGFINAQEDQNKTNSSNIKVYPLNTAIPNTPKTTSKASYNTYKWAVKLDPMALVGSEIPIIGEYRITSHISLEASAGLTYSLFNGNSFFSELSDRKYTGTRLTTKPSLGSAFRAGIKFYPSSYDDALEGWAFGLQVFTKTLNRVSKNDEYIYSNVDVSGLKDTLNKTGVQFTISRQVFFESNICFEYMLGLGLASIDESFYTIDSTSGTQKQRFSFEESSLNIFFGTRFGFGK